jgi:hypothetical protein
MRRHNHSRVVFAAAISTLAVFARPVRGDVVTDWNQVALQATAIPPNAMLQSRVMAAVHVAMLDALRASESLEGSARDVAVSGAAYGVLSRLTAGQGDALDAALKKAIDGVPSSPSKTHALTLGTKAAETVVAQRRADGSDAKAAFTPSAGAGRWQPTPPANAPGILPHWGAVKPFVIESPTQFAMKGPPAHDGPAFARDLDEVRAVGARLSTTRTADQTAAAIFWTVQTVVPWNAAARAAAGARGNTREENARLFAALNAACADASIATFEVKYRLQHWRPVTAIRARAGQGTPDATWEPLLGTPPHPEYPSSHAACSGAAEAVLQGFFENDRVTVSVTYPPVFGVTRSYGSFSQMAQEVDDARVWGGIHFRTADVDGRELGRRIGVHVLKRLAAPPVASN